MNIESDTLFSDARWLKSSANEGYGSLPIPTKRDDEITNLLGEWRGLDSVPRDSAIQRIDPDQCASLLAYSERMASLAVRNRDRNTLLLGLLAVGISGWRDDPRDGMMLLSLFFDAAQRLGVPPSSLFNDAGTLLPVDIGSELRAFLNRSPEDRSIRVMGYSDGNDADGFRYQYDG
jgi:hypothetical protein